jgi:AmiR/NasT family two-component response regulator
MGIGRKSRKEYNYGMKRVTIQKEAKAMRRVFILSSHPLFGQGVESLLRQEARLEIVGQETDVDKAVERIKELQPNVVILDCTEPRCDPTPVVMHILREGLETKVIGLNLQDNTMYIYRGEQRVVEAVKDLVEAIGPLSLEPVSSADLSRLNSSQNPRKGGESNVDQRGQMSPEG